MFEPFLGEIALYPYNFAPRGWAFCHGQILSIAQNSALFSLLGTTYGGDGRTTFALPDLRGRVPMGFGQGPGLSIRDLGERGGVESVTLTTSEIPSHAHGQPASSQLQTTNRPDGAVPALGGQYAATPDTSTAPTAPAGGSQPHTNVQPYLGLNYCIALEGIFPARN